MGRTNNNIDGIKEYTFVCACGRQITAKNEKLINKLEKLHTSKCEEYKKATDSGNFHYQEFQDVFSHKTCKITNHSTM